MEKNVLKISMAGVLVLCSMAFAAPGWFVQTDVNQDFRYRIHDFSTDGASQGATRYRERIRYRLGLTSKINDEFTAGARLATGEAVDAANANHYNSQSTTQTLDGQFSNKNINLDQAYLSYAPKWIPSAAGKFKLTVGKFDVKDGIYTATNGVWDSNISLEGKNLNYTYNDLGLKGLDVFANVGSYVLAGDVRANTQVVKGDGSTLNNTGGSPLTLEARQLGMKWKINSMYNFETAYAEYTVPMWNHSMGSVTALDTSDDRSINHIAAKFGINLSVPYFEKITFMYEDLINQNDVMTKVQDDGVLGGKSETAKNKHSTAYGIEFGTAKMAKLGDYSLRYMERRVENGVGWTLMEDAHKIQNTKGQQYALTLGVAENVSFTAEQYVLTYIDALNDSQKSWNDTRFEINVKF